MDAVKVIVKPSLLAKIQVLQTKAMVVGASYKVPIFCRQSPQTDVKIQIKPEGYDLIVSPSVITFTTDLLETAFTVEVLPNATLKTHYINYVINGTNKASYEIYEYSIVMVSKVNQTQPTFSVVQNSLGSQDANFTVTSNTYSLVYYEVALRGHTFTDILNVRTKINA